MSTVVDPPNDPVQPPATEGDGSSVKLIIRAAGELADTGTAEAAFASPPSAQPGVAVVIDLSAVTYLSMEAVVPLMTLARQCATDGRAVRTVASVPVRRKLATLGLNTVLPLTRPPHDYQSLSHAETLGSTVARPGRLGGARSPELARAWPVVE